MEISKISTFGQSRTIPTLAVYKLARRFPRDEVIPTGEPDAAGLCFYQS